MTELYNTVTDGRGVTRVRNPYDAEIVRSFSEQNTSQAGHFIFNITGLEETESVLEAQLHVYRMKSRKSPAPDSYLYHYYLVSVYQVLDKDFLHRPELNRLLTVQYSSGHLVGWEVYNVKSAILGWLSGAAANLGLLVSATSIFGMPVELRLARRNRRHGDKQPILVLFNSDSRKTRKSPMPELGPPPNYPIYYSRFNRRPQVDEEHVDRVQRRSLYWVMGLQENQQHLREPQGSQDSPQGAATSHLLRDWNTPLDSPQGALSSQLQRDWNIPLDSPQGAATSHLLRDWNTPLDSPQGALFSQLQKDWNTSLNSSSGAVSPQPQRAQTSPPYPGQGATSSLPQENQFLLQSEKELYVLEKQGNDSLETQRNRSVVQRFRKQHREGVSLQSRGGSEQACAIHDLYVDFANMGWSSTIIYPRGYNAYYCGGHCFFPIDDKQAPTNHATVQGILDLDASPDVSGPCCVPETLLPLSILFFDNSDSVVLKRYEDMVADSCSCR